jgi:phospholipase C
VVNNTYLGHVSASAHNIVVANGIKLCCEAIRKSPLWNDGLLIVTWDEHGGFYDHLPPGQPLRPDSLTSHLIMALPPN